MANSYFIGMRDDQEFVTGEIPESYRKGYLELVPNGDATLTALTALMPSEKVKGSVFNWFQKDLPSRRATFAAGSIYTNAACTAAYVSGGTSGQTVYAKVTTTQMDQFVVGSTVRSFVVDGTTGEISSDQPINMKITNKTPLDATYTSVSLYLLEADDNATSSSKTLANATGFFKLGNAQPQGGTRPASYSIGPTLYTNYTQIIRTAVDTTRSAEEQELRTEAHLTTCRKDAMRDHMLDLEMQFLFGKKAALTGANGKRETYTDGLITFIQAYGVNKDYRLETGAAYAGQKWKNVGWDYMDAVLEEMFRYGSSERLVFCGSLALLGIQQLVKELGMYTLNPTISKAGGIKVLSWETVFGTVHFKRHPLFTHEATLRNMMAAFEPANIKYRFVTDTMFKPDKLYEMGGETEIDGRQEGWITEAGLELGVPQTTMLLDGIGADNAQVAS